MSNLPDNCSESDIAAHFDADESAPELCQRCEERDDETKWCRRHGGWYCPDCAIAQDKADALSLADDLEDALKQIAMLELRIVRLKAGSVNARLAASHQALRDIIHDYLTGQVHGENWQTIANADAIIAAMKGGAV